VSPEQLEQDAEVYDSPSFVRLFPEASISASVSAGWLPPSRSVAEQKPLAGDQRDLINRTELQHDSVIAGEGRC